MRADAIPFQIYLTNLLAKARRQFVGRVGDISFNLPFISFSVSPKDREKQVACEIVIRWFLSRDSENAASPVNL